MANPQKLLDSVLDLIALDIAHIKLQVKEGKLEHTAALDLTRYTTTLRALIESKKEDDKQEEKSLATLTNEELREMARKLASDLESK